MDHSDQRHLMRDSLFVLARLTIEGRPGELQVRVRNLSNGGLMAEGGVKVTCGTPVKVEVRNIGWVEGQVAWVQDNRFGIGFNQEIDARLARSPVRGEEPEVWRPAATARTRWIGHDSGRLRKV